MLFRSLVAATALFAAVPAFAQEATPQAGDRPDIAAGAAQFIKPTNAERTQVLVGFLTTLGFTPEIQTFEGGNQATGPMEGANVVVTVGQGDKDIVLTAHYDAVKLRDGTLSQGIVDNVGSVMAMMEAAKTLDMALEGQPVAHREARRPSGGHVDRGLRTVRDRDRPGARGCGRSFLRARRAGGEHECDGDGDGDPHSTTRGWHE